MRDVAEEMGVGHTFRAGRRRASSSARRPGEEVPDPYFGGAGPARHGCLHCGECMTGCRHDAKNTLVKNYLHLAEAAGVARPPADDGDAHPPARTATCPAPRATRSTCARTGRPGGRRTLARRPGRRRRRRRSAPSGCCTACGAGATCRASPRGSASSRAPTPRPSSPRARPRDDVDFTRGVSITSSIHPDPHTHVEPVRYGRGSNLLALLSAVLVDGTTRDGRPHARRARPVVAPDRRRGAALAADPARPAPPAALGRAVDRAAGDAVAGQLADAAAAAPVPGPHLPPGRRHAEPRVDPVGPRRRPARRPPHRRLPRRRELDAGQRAGHRALPRRRGDLRDAGDGRRRPVPPPARAPRRPRRRRLDGAGEPRGEPVADDHRARRARDVAVAQPRRARPASRSRRALPPRGARRPAPPRRARRRPGRAADRPPTCPSPSIGAPQ